MGINKKTFSELLRVGRSVNSLYFNIRFIRPNNFTEKAENRYSFVVSSKVSKLATVRNLLKRRGRAIVNKHKNEVISPLICAFLFKPESIKLSYSELESAIISTLKTSKLVK